MASEPKRSNANKVPVALPKADTTQSTNLQPVSQDVGLYMAVGSRARITTAQPNQTTIEGTIYAADPVMNLIVLYTSSQVQANNISPSTLAAPAGSYRLIPISQISSFQLLALYQPDTSNVPVTAPQNTLDTAALNARLQRNVDIAQQSQARQGPKGTSGVEQAVFDALSRTFRTRWQGSSMIVSDQFIIEKPYDGRSIKLLPGATGDLERMKRVIEMEKKKAELKQPLGSLLPAVGNGTTRVPQTSGQRKGG